MSAPIPPSPEAEAVPPAPRPRPRGSTRIGLALLVLLAGWFVVTQIVRSTGPTVPWIRNDLPLAEQQARAGGRLIFLLLHEPGCKLTEANDRDVFSQRYARTRLANLVCCRVELKPDDPLRRRFAVTRTPLMLVLAPDRSAPLSRMEGKIDQLQFETYVPEARP
jgi:hypothetical protein